MKTERISILASPELKAYLTAKADQEGISVSELVRRRCDWTRADGKELLADMAAELRKATDQARGSMDEGLRLVSEALHEIHDPDQDKSA